MVIFQEASSPLYDAQGRARAQSTLSGTRALRVQQKCAPCPPRPPWSPERQNREFWLNPLPPRQPHSWLHPIMWLPRHFNQQILYLA